MLLSDFVRMKVWKIHEKPAARSQTAEPAA